MKRMKFTVCVVIFALWDLSKVKGEYVSTQTQFDYDVVVDATTTTGVLEKMWDSTGFSPPKPGQDSVDYLTSKTQHINLALIGSLPFKAISHVRIHWLLDLIKVNSIGFGREIRFDYQLLDDLISWLRVFRIRPGFELMGNPGSLFGDLDYNPETLLLWQSFMADLAFHYIDKFGLKEVKTWRFELWNEPDSKQYNILNLTTSGYLKYANASMKGLRVWGLKVSGPAGTFRDLQHHNLSWGLLHMCNSMIEQTGHQCGLETITFHKKGEGVAQNVVSSSSAFYSLASTRYPLLGKTMNFANNEADILSGWWREESWRGDVNYSAFVCQVLSSFLLAIEKNKLPLSYISNDNGFLNQPPAYFDQRTLLVRFQMNNSRDVHSQFVRKPVMIAMALLSYLGPKKLKVIQRQRNLSESDARLSVLAGGESSEFRDWNAAVVLAVSPLASRLNCSDKTVRLSLKPPPNTEVKFVLYQLDNVLSNPRNIWVKHGKPDFPSDTLLHKMRDNEGPQIEEFQRGNGSEEWVTLTLKARCPSVTMVHLCQKPLKPPAKVLSLSALNITVNEVLLFWQDSDTKCVKTYEVYFCQGKCSSGEYRLITNGEVIMLSYHFKPVSDGSSSTEATTGKYKVRVRDYWNYSSDFSEVLHYP